MKVLNSSFTFTVKVGQEHFGGHFDYRKKNAEVVKMSFNKLPKAEGKGYRYSQINYLKLVNNEWVLWDINKKTPKRNSKDDGPVYYIFREAYGLAQLH